MEPVSCGDENRPIPELWSGQRSAWLWCCPNCGCFRALLPVDLAASPPSRGHVLHHLEAACPWLHTAPRPQRCVARRWVPGLRHPTLSPALEQVAPVAVVGPVRVLSHPSSSGPCPGHTARTQHSDVGPGRRVLRKRPAERGQAGQSDHFQNP